MLQPVPLYGQSGAADVLPSVPFARRKILQRMSGRAEGQTGAERVTTPNGRLTNDDGGGTALRIEAGTAAVVVVAA